MANPIQKGDLISDEALKALEEMSRLLREDKENMDALMASFKQYAGSIQPSIAANNGNNDALTAALQKVSELEKAYSDLQKLMKENAATQKAVAAEKRKYAKLTAEEATEVKNLRTELKWLNDEDKEVSSYVKKKIEAINAEKMSYNQLQQTYNAVRDALNKMTPEQLKSTEAGKLLAAQGLKIRDAMNEMQKATGNYTLQVGKYRAAFDGLGYSFQQILREAPSALNLNQFFLAISNNIPMFLDQLKAFQDEQKEIKANLAQMTEGTKEYSEQLGKVMTVGQKLAKTLLSWQTLVLVGLLVIRNWDRIVNLAQKLFKKVEEGLDTMRRMRQVVNEIDEKVENSISKVVVELGELNNRLADVTQGSKEWMNITERIKEILGDSYDIAGKMPGEIQKITQAYIQQAEQLAKNKFVVDKIAENADKSFKRDRAIEMILKSGDVASAAKIFGYEEDSDQYKALADAANASMPLPSQTDANEKIWEVVDGKPRRVGYDKWMTNMLNRTFDELEGELFTNKDLEDLWNRYYVPMATNADNGPKGSSPSEQSVTDRYWEAEQELLEKMKTGYDLERALAKLNRDKEREELTNWYVDQRLALDENLKNGFISQQKYDTDIQELDRENATLREGINRKYWDNINRINREEAEKALKAREDRTIREINAITAVELKASSKRVRNTAQEAAKNNVLVENLNRLLNARKELIALDIASDETRSIEERTKALEKLNKEISKYASQLDFSKRLGTYSSLSDMITKNINVSGGNKKSILTNIIGEDAMKTAAESLGEGFEDWVDGQFETWMNSATQAVSTWYSTTMGYINDLISAYVELANAKAEAAAEATEAAQEEYDKEKALLEAGYASRVEATWAEYQEKKAAQEKAEADAKAAAQAQQQLNEVETMGSLIVASANIWKTFSKIPTVGIPLAIAALTTMWGSFAAAKIKAAEVSKYGEGGFEVLEGGSHASGHDIDLGVRNRRGRRMRAEGKEGLGIFSRRAMEHYGANNIEAMVNSVNRLEFEGNAAKRMSLERNIGLQMLSMPRTDLHRLESGMDKLVSYGAKSVHHNPDGTVVETRKNARITYHTMR